MNDKEIMDARKHCAEWPEKILLGTRYWGKDARLPPRYFGAKNTVEIHDDTKAVEYKRADIVLQRQKDVLALVEEALNEINIHTELVLILEDVVDLLYKQMGEVV